MRSVNLVSKQPSRVHSRRSWRPPAHSAPTAAAIVAFVWIATVALDIGKVRHALANQKLELQLCKNAVTEHNPPEQPDPRLPSTLRSIVAYQSTESIEHALVDIINASSDMTTYDSLVVQRAHLKSVTLDTLSECLSATYTVQLRGTGQDSISIAQLSGRIADLDGFSGVRTGKIDQNDITSTGYRQFHLQADYKQQLALYNEAVGQ